MGVHRYVLRDNIFDPYQTEPDLINGIFPYTHGNIPFTIYPDVL